MQLATNYDTPTFDIPSCLPSYALIFTQLWCTSKYALQHAHVIILLADILYASSDEADTSEPVKVIRACTCQHDSAMFTA